MKKNKNATSSFSVGYLSSFHSFKKPEVSGGVIWKLSSRALLYSLMYLTKTQLKPVLSLWFDPIKPGIVAYYARSRWYSSSIVVANAGLGRARHQSWIRSYSSSVCRLLARGAEKKRISIFTLVHVTIRVGKGKFFSEDITLLVRSPIFANILLLLNIFQYIGTVKCLKKLAVWRAA